MVLDRAVAMLKVGDNGEYLEGMPIEVIEEREWGKPLEKILSENCRRVYVPLLISEAMVPVFKAWMEPTGFKAELGPMETPEPSTAYRIRNRMIPLDALATATGNVNLVKDARDSAKILPLIDGTSISENIAVDSQTISPIRGIPDLNAISGGSVTVGSGGTYATWALLITDVIGLTGHLTATQISAITETGTTALNVAMNGYNITFTSNSHPNGDFGAGWLTTCTFNLNAQTVLQFINTSGSSATMTLSHLNFKYTGTVTGNYGNFIRYTTATTNITNAMNDCLFDANSKEIQCIRLQHASAVVKAYNVVCTGGAAAGAKFCGGLTTVFAHVSCVFENMSIYDFSGADAAHGNCVWNYSDDAYTLTNIAAFDGTACYAYGAGATSGLGSATANKCASSDASGSEAPLRNLVAATVFQSVTIGDGETFVKPVSGQSLNETGVAPSLPANTYYINDVVHGASIDIGAKGLAAAGGDHTSIMRGVGRGVMRGAR